MKFKPLATLSFFFAFLLIIFLPSPTLSAVELCTCEDGTSMAAQASLEICCNVCSSFTGTSVSSVYYGSTSQSCAMVPPSPTPTPSGGGGTSPAPTPPAPAPTVTLPPPPTQCDAVNPECTKAWGEGKKSRFISSRDCYCCGNCGFNDIVNIFINAADYLFGILGALALLFFIYGGVIWLTAGGSAGQIDKGKKILLGALIGMLLALGAWLIIKFLVTALGVTTEVRGF